MRFKHICINGLWILYQLEALTSFVEISSLHHWEAVLDWICGHTTANCMTSRDYSSSLN